MFKMDRTVSKKLTHEEAEKANLFSDDISYGQRLAEGWYITCMAYGIDYKNPPKMDKTFSSTRKSNTNG
jgi:hypothetical protein